MINVDIVVVVVCVYVCLQINNVGDPFSEGTNRSHSKFMERAVLDYFASLWRARWPHDQGQPNNQDKLPDRKSYWGYCLSMGATEGNMYGMWNGRDYLAGKVMLSDKIKPEYVKASVEPSNIYELDEAEAALRAKRSFTPICFFSKDTHYSLKKCMTILNIRTFYEEGSLLYPNLCPALPNRTKKSWPHTVPSNEDGSVDIDSLAILVEFFVKLGYPILVNFNYGTTFKGAYDDVEAAGERLIPILEKYGMYERIIRFKHRGQRTSISRNGFWFHVDGALGAAYMPFIEAAHASKLLDDAGTPIMPHRGPNFDFRLPFVHSISMSGHKWIGAPVPCGIYMSKTVYQLMPPEIPMYIGSADTTFAGSRSGLAAMFLWDFISRNPLPKLVQRAIQSEETAAYLEAKLKGVEEALHADLYVSRTTLSLTVVFKRPAQTMVDKYSLSTETRSEEDDSKNGAKNPKYFAHAFAMNHVGLDLVDEFANDLLLHGYPQELEALSKSHPVEHDNIMIMTI